VRTERDAVAVPGANESVPDLEPSGVGAADRVFDLFPVEGGPVVVAEANADDEFVQAGEPPSSRATPNRSGWCRNANARTRTSRCGSGSSVIVVIRRGQ